MTYIEEVGHLAQRVVPDLVASIFEEGSGWQRATGENCKRLGIASNGVAYSSSTSALALIVQRSATGKDFPVNAAGLAFLESTKAKGSRKDGAPVLHAFVVLADADPQDGNERAQKLVELLTVEETRERLKGARLISGSYGAYYWIRSSEGDCPF